MNEVKIGGELNLQPDSLLAEVAQNIQMIVTTPKGTVPLDREFGIDVGMLDAPVAVNQVRMTRSIIAACKKFESRAEVTAVRYEVGLDGKLAPVVQFVLKR